MSNRSRSEQEARSDFFTALAGRGISAFLTAVSVLALLVFPSSRAALPSTAIELRSLRTHSRLVIKVDAGVPAELKSTSRGFELLLRGISLSELGAPLGEEARWAEQFTRIENERLESLRFAETAEGLKVLGAWRFPKGDQAPAHPEMETFDYRDRDPSRYVLDFWPKTGPSVAEVRRLRFERDRKARFQRAEADAKRRSERRTASSEAKTAQVDIARFCKEPLSEKNEVFLPFLPLHGNVDFSRWFPVTTPDSDFEYSNPRQTSQRSGQQADPRGERHDDEDYVSLALKLYRQGKNALAIRTIEFLEEEYPKSRFRLEMSFLRANALIRLGHPEQAEAILNRLVVENPSSPEAAAMGGFLAARLFARGDHHAALERFQALQAHFPNHRLSWVFHLGMAESFYALKNTERAAKEYTWIIEHADSRQARAEAAARLGDLHLERSQNEQALAAYFRALNYFPSESGGIPSLHLNRAEALYGLRDLDRAGQAFEGYLKKFPSDSQGWRATFRMGEIEGWRSPREADGASRRWYYETINRYPTSPGATLARLRLLPCGDHAGFDAASMERFFSDEADRFDTRQVSPGRYEDLKGLSRIRALIAFGQPRRAFALAVGNSRATRSPEVEAVLSGMLGPLFRWSIVDLLKQGRKYEALSFFADQAASVRKELVSIDPDYLLRLSHAASELSLGKLALELADGYQHVLQTRTPASTEEDETDRRLRASEQSISEARGLWVQDRPEANAARIRELLARVVEESPHSYDREVMLGLLDEKADSLRSALAHALRARTLIPQSKIGLRLDHWIARLQMRAGDPRSALEIFRELEKRIRLRNAEKSAPEQESAASLYGIPPAPTLDETLSAQGELLSKLGQWGEAAQAYAQVVEGGKAGDPVLYGYARALLRTRRRADRERALATLGRLAGESKDDFWKRLGREALETEKRSQ